VICFGTRIGVCCGAGGVCTDLQKPEAPPIFQTLENTKWDSQAADSVYASKEALCKVLNLGHTALVNARWFVEQHGRGGKLLKRQQMESDFPDSLVTELQPEEIWDMKFEKGFSFIEMDSGGKWLLIAISYPWLDKDPTR